MLLHEGTAITQPQLGSTGLAEENQKLQDLPEVKSKVRVSHGRLIRSQSGECSIS